MRLLSSSIFAWLRGKIPLQEGKGMNPWEAEQVLSALHQRNPDATSLDLSRWSLIEVPFNLAEFRALESLDLSHNSLMDLGGVLLELKSLRALDVSDNGLAEVPRVIPLLGKLERLNLSGNRIATAPVEMLALRHLRRLNLRGNPITLDHVPEPLRAVTVL